MQNESTLDQYELERRASFPEQNPSFVLEINASGDLTYCNPAIRHQAALWEVTIADLLPADIQAIVHNCLAQQISTQIESQLKNRTFTWHFYPVLAAQVVRAYGLDISDQKHAEDRYFTLVENINEGLAIADTNENFICVNQAAADILGYTKAELLTKTLADLIWPDDFQRVIAETGKRLQGKSSIYQIRMRRKDGAWLHIKVSATPYCDVNDQKIIGTLGLFQDITSQIESANALELQGIYFQQLFENSPQAIVMMNAEGRVVNLNKGFVKLFQYTLAEIKEQLFADFLVPENRTEENQNIIRDVLQGNIIDLETIRSRKDGRKLNVSLLAHPIILNEKSIGAYFSFRDITKQKRARNALRRKYQELKIANKIQQDILSLVSHELRTPLAIIHGNTELLIDYGNEISAEERHQLLLTIIENTNRQTHMIDDILFIANLDQIHRHYAESPIYIQSIIDSVVLHQMVTAMQKEINIYIDITDDLPTVMADPFLLTRVFEELLDNALKFTPQGGRVDIRAYSTPTELGVEICDSGIGIPPDKLEAIFNRFYQVELADKRVYGGFGLGLTVVRELINLHKGRVTVTSEVGKGSCFSVFLRINPDFAAGESE